MYFFPKLQEDYGGNSKRGEKVDIVEYIWEVGLDEFPSTGHRHEGKRESKEEQRLYI